MADGFLSRWSRQKALAEKIQAQSERAEPKPTAASAVPAASSATATAPSSSASTPTAANNAAAPAAPAARGAASAMGQSPSDDAPGLQIKLPSLEDARQLPIGADVSEFMRPGVSPEARELALQKLFSDPKYNVICEMNDYIADYANMPDLPKSELSKYTHLAGLFLFEDPPWKKEMQREAAAKAAAAHRAAEQDQAAGHNQAAPQAPANAGQDDRAAEATDASAEAAPPDIHSTTQFMPPTPSFPAANASPVPTRRYAPTLRKESQ